MWATNKRGVHRRPLRRQRGTTAVEVSVLSLLFFTLIFGIMEVSRLLYVYNTLQEVTRRAAALAVHVYPNDTSAINSVKQKAIFRDAPGELILAPPVTEQYVRIDYLAFDLSRMPESAWPVDAATNRLICSANPHAANCIRFVRARICMPSADETCDAVMSKMMVPLLDWTARLSRAPTIAPVETLGYVPGTAPSPPPCPCS